MQHRPVIIVSNRLPITVEQEDGTARIVPSSGGLVTALRPLIQAESHRWVGWTGTHYDAQVEEALRHASLALPLDGLVPVFLSEEETALFYRGCCNQIIWPLFHDFTPSMIFAPEYWAAYRRVNRKFALTVESVSRDADFVWVHDYQLMLLGKELRRLKVADRLSYFHHIPFPPPDLLEKLPWCKELLQSLLQFDELGFQTVRDQRNFVRCLRRCLGCQHVSRVGERLLVRAEQRSVLLGSHPVSISYQEFAAPSASSEVSTAAAAIRKQLGCKKVVVGLDRLDYTKGIPERLEAFRNLLRSRPSWRGAVSLMQVVIPSRERIPAYEQLKTELEQLITSINCELATPDWTPVHYLYGQVCRSELLAIYRAADVALVTPLRDGMNLVAKEFCAARTDERGVLVLSEFAGSALELGQGALLVNPYDVEAIASAVHRALGMGEKEQQARMSAMRSWLRSHDVHRWAEAFCSDQYYRHLRQGLSLTSTRPAAQAAGRASYFDVASGLSL